jgi:hypothetical protein
MLGPDEIRVLEMLEEEPRVGTRQGADWHLDNGKWVSGAMLGFFKIKGYMTVEELPDEGGAVQKRFAITSEGTKLLEELRATSS